jgi:transposase-like protein DUF772
MEQLDYNLMFRWFVGLGIDDPVWVPTVFTKNRDRLLDADVAAKFMEQVLAHKEVRRLLSDEHFSVDGTLIEAWASMKSFQPKPEPTAGKPPDKTGGDPPAPPTAEIKPTPPPGPETMSQRPQGERQLHATSIRPASRDKVPTRRGFQQPAGPVATYRCTLCRAGSKGTSKGRAQHQRERQRAA